jgi:hypothetical protein
MTAKPNNVTSLELYRNAQALCFELEAREGITDDELEEAIGGFLSGSEDKLDRHRYAIDQFVNQAKLYRAEVQRLQGRARMLEGIAKRIKQHAQLVLEARCELLGEDDGRKLETDAGIVYLRKGKSLEIGDPDAFVEEHISSDWVVHKPSIDKRAITAAIKGGQEVSGALLLDSLSVIFK